MTVSVLEAADRTEVFVPHRFAEQLVDLGEIRMNYVVEGDPADPALLLVSPHVGSWWGYEPAIALLSKHFQVFAVDLRGQGRSTWTPGRYTLDNCGNDLVRFIDLVIGRPTVVAGSSAGGVIATWLAAFAKPGQLRGVILEDPPLFATQVAPPYGPGTGQALGPMFALWNKWLGDQWSIGDWDGLCQAMKDELPGLTFFLSDGTGSDPAPEPPQHFKEYDPEWARSWATDLANAACDHQALLAQIKVPVLFTRHFRRTDPDTGHSGGATTDIQAHNAHRLMRATGQTVTLLDLPDAGHLLHENEPERYAKIVADWISELTP